MGVLTKAHVGFLVFQGYVSELAAKSPRELTALFEQVGGLVGWWGVVEWSVRKASAGVASRGLTPHLSRADLGLG